MMRLNSISKQLKYSVRLLTTIFLFVAVSAIYALVQFDSDADPIAPKLNLFIDQSTQQFRLLEQQSYALREPLEFMAWSNDRVRLGEAYAQTLRKQINLQPFNSKLWALLVYAQVEAKTDRAQQHWTMRRALKLNRWNLANRSLVSRPCIIDAPQIMQDQGAQLCAELLASLPASMPTDKLAKLMGVRPNALLDALVKQGLRTMQGQSK